MYPEGVRSFAPYVGLMGCAAAVSVLATSSRAFAQPEPAPSASEAPAPQPPPADAQPIDVGASPPPASAPAASAPPEPPKPSSIDATVPGQRPTPLHGGSDFIIPVAHLGAGTIPRPKAKDVLTLAPGIFLTNEGGDGHAEQVFLRGFDAREGQDIEFTVDGVPINESGNLHGNGYADTHFIIPELIESLRVNEGPFDPHQGNYAVAGSADFHLGLAQRGLSAKYTGGSFNTHRLLLTWGPPDTSTHTFAGVELYTTDGYGQNRDAVRGSAMGQYEGKLGENGSYRVGGQAYVNVYHEAGVIREDDYDAGRIGFYDTYDPNQGGTSMRFSGYGDLETKAGDFVLKQQFFAIYRNMGLRENFTGFLLDVQSPLQEPHGQRGDLIDLEMNEGTFGARGSARLRTKLFNQTQEIEFGYYARGDDVHGTQMRIEHATGHPYHVDADLSSVLGDIGPYIDASVKPLSWLTFRGGLRADVLPYNVTNNCAVQSVAHPSKIDPPGDASCLSQEDFGTHREPVQPVSTGGLLLLPRATLMVGPFEGFTVSASVGRGVRSVDPSYIIQDTATPFASIVSYEGGVTFTKGFGDTSIAARSIFFQTHVDKDLIFSETEGRNVLGGGSTRTGWVGAARVGGDHFDVNTDVTLVKSVLDDTGLLVPYVPDVVFRTTAAVFGQLPWHLAKEPFRGAVGAGFTLVGHRPLPYGQTSDLITQLDAQVSLGWSHYEIGIQGQNLLAQKYRLGEYDFASDFNPSGAPTLVPVRHFTAGDPISIFAVAAVNFGGNPSP